MAIVYYPKDQFIAYRDTTNAAFQQLILASSPGTVLYFDTGSGLNVASASQLFITASWAQTASVSVIFNIQNTTSSVSSSWASQSLSSSFATKAVTSSYANKSQNLDTEAYQFERWDFLSAVTQSNILGDGTWSINTGSILATTPGPSTVNHPGIITRRSSAVIDQVNGFFVGTDITLQYMNVADMGQCKFIVQLTTGSYSQSVRVGLFGNVSQDPPSSGFWFEKFSTKDNGVGSVWWAVASGVGNVTSASTGISSTASAVWRNFGITPNTSSVSATGSDYYIDGALVATLKQPSSLSIGTNMGVQQMPRNAVAYDILIDYISLASFPYNFLVR